MAAVEAGTNTEAQEADRGIPQLNSRRGGPPAALKIVILIAIVLAVLGAIGFVTINKFKTERQASKQVDQKTDTRSRLPEIEELTLPETPTPLPAETAEVSDPSPSPRSRRSPSGEQVPALSQAQVAAADQLARRQRAPLMAYHQVAQPAAALDAAAPVALPQGMAWPFPSQPSADAGNDDPSGLAAALQGMSAGPSTAQALTDPNMTISQASVLPCVLNTAINSTVPGMVSCTLSSDVYSTNGRVLLLDRGSRIVGQYQNAAFKQGMSRIFVLWTRIETPMGVIISLDSPSTDALGRSGVAGDVNRHFWQRFGAGLLLSLVDDALQYATDSQRSNDQAAAGVEFSNTSAAGRNAASIAVENSVGIPPTLSVNQGALLNVFVARDLYFGNVYGLRTAAR